MTPLRIFLASLFLLACGDDDGSSDTGVDAAVDAVTADSGTDTGADIGADTAVADAGSDAPIGECIDLAPTGSEEIIISQIDIANGMVEVFNPAGVEFIWANHWWCAQPGYEMVGAPTTVPASGYQVYNILRTLGSRAELAIYLNPLAGRPNFGDGSLMVDYVCWGTPSNRMDEAMDAGRWSGECLTAPTSGAITRLPGTDGTSAASYDSTGTFAANICE